MCTRKKQWPISELLRTSVSKRVLVHNHSNGNELRILMQIKHELGNGPLVLVSLLIGWKNGTRTLNQSLSEVMQNQCNSLITFDTQLKTALRSLML